MNGDQLARIADQLGPECSARLKWLLSVAQSDDQAEEVHVHHPDHAGRSGALRAAPEDEATNWEE